MQFCFMKKIGFFLITIVTFSQSCKKISTCSDGEVCLKNESNTIVHYSEGSTIYTDSLYPGQTKCFNIGKIKTRPWGGTSKIVYINSDHGSYSFEVTTCHYVHRFR